MSNNLKKQFNEKISQKLKQEFGYKNINEVPYIEKIVINTGIGKFKGDKKSIEMVKKAVSRLSSQVPVERLAKKSISNFKVRQGEVIGYKVTLRKQRMYEFLEKLIKISLPRIRDFRGVKANAFDGRGNYTLGIKEHTIFPETKDDSADNLIGLEINICTTAKTDKEGASLLKELGFPFKKK